MYTDHKTINSSDPGCINIIQITDMHIFLPGQQQPMGFDTVASLESVIEKINRDEDPDLVLATGDLVHEPGSAVYLKLNRILRQLERPVICLPGNHDNSGLMHSHACGNGIFTDKSVDCGPWRFVMLDSVIENAEGGYLQREELEFLKNQLLRKPAANVAVCLHHQPVNIGSPWMDAMQLQNGREFLEILEYCQDVKCVLWGHIHQEFSSRHEHIHLFGSPSTCIQFKPVTEKFTKDVLPPGYRKLQLYSDGRISTTVKWLN